LLEAVEKEEAKRDTRIRKVQGQVKGMQGCALQPFIQKVLVPDVKVTEEDSKAIASSRRRFHYPEMMKVSTWYLRPEQAEPPLSG
jgi:hypothetical protein